MSEDAKSAERQRLAAALRENLRRRKTAPRSPRINAEHRDAAAEPPSPRTTSPAAAMDRESKG